MRYFLGILVTLGLIVLIIVLLLGGGRGGSKTPTVQPIRLYDYVNSTSTAQLVIDGPVVSDSKHRSTRISVDQNTVTATLYDGYQQTEERTLTYPNNRDAYEVFLRSLQHSGFTLKNKNTVKDERGYCPTGYRYVLTFQNGGDDIIRSWTTSCGTATPGNYAGPISTVTNLFRAQVPDYNKLITGTNLY